MKKILSIATRLIITLLSLTVIMAIIVFLTLKASLPDLKGDFTASGLSKTISIKRDDNGVAHVFADYEHDLYFGLGYAHAQDRMWQMEMNRRTPKGELAEILGKEALEYDRFFRTLGLKQAAEKALETMPGEGLMMLESYARGVNTWLKQGHTLPPEFILSGTKPEPWSELDSLVWMKMFWMDLSANYGHELARARLLQKLPPQRVAEFKPAYPGEDFGPLPTLDALLAELPLDALAFDNMTAKPPGYGSNNWVVDGSMTKSGLPMLSNDPHMTLTTPSIWYLSHLHLTSEKHHTIGVTTPGSPVVVLGHNYDIAWGFTNTASDVQDLYIEKIIDEDSYMSPSGPMQFEKRTEIINVKGQDPVTITVRSTRNGPLLSDLGGSRWQIAGKGYGLSLKWVALEDTDTAIAAGYRIANAKDFEGFQASGLAYMGPQQNMVYADTAGNIGFNSPARVPIRHADNAIRGRIPSPGWIAKYDWQGYIPANEMPMRFNPKSGMIATANEKIVDDDYPHFLTGDWEPSYRSDRIYTLLREKAPHDGATFLDILGDVRSNAAADLLPPMLAGADNLPEDIRETLRSWDFRMTTDSVEAMIFVAWQRNFAAAVYRDELENLFNSYVGRKPKFIESLFLNPEIGAWWCDDKATDTTTETCSDQLEKSWVAANAELTRKLGPDWTTWSYGRLHAVHQDHTPFSKVPLLRDWFGSTIPQDGSNYTVNVAGVGFKSEDTYTSHYGPSYRAVYNLSDLRASTFMLPTGQSGHFLSPWYSNMIKPWQRVEGFTIPQWDGSEEVEHTITIRPNTIKPEPDR